MRKHFGLLAILLLSVSLLAHFPQARADVLQVPEDYPTIQAAVDAAEPGYTIEVSPDTYHESVIVSESLTIIGLDKSTTIVHGSTDGGGYAFWLDTDGVSISGFTIRDCSNYGVIAYFSGGHTIDDNIFINNGYGVFLTNSPSANYITHNSFFNNGFRSISVAFSNENTISDNYISDSTYGIKLDDESQFTSITNNTVTGTSHGIYIRLSNNNNVDQNDITSIITGIASVSSDYINIRNNTVSECAYGIEIWSSVYNTVFANTVGQNGYGIYLVYANDNTIDANLASNNDWGIRLIESGSNTIIQNTFSFNTYGLDMTSYSTGNTIAWNNILNNSLQMHQDSTSGINTWHKDKEDKTYGSYWSNYTGEDTDGDGVGDTHPFPHMGVDDYPLIDPWSTVHDLAVISVTASDDTVYQGQVVNITVVVRNEGTVAETFNVTARYFNRLMGTKEVTNLTRLRTTTIVFSWNTTDVPTCFNYEISAKTEPIEGETDNFDNTFIDGTIKVKIPGDVDGDGDVDRYDFSGYASAYGTVEGEPDYDSECDFDGDGAVDRYDFTIFGANYGKTC